MPVNNSQEIPIKITGSSIFGRYKKISDERTFNMFISDDWLVNYAGFKKVADIDPSGSGRGFFNSIRGGFLIAVVAGSVYRIDSDLIPVFIAAIDSTSGDVTIDENLSNQICIVDGTSAYIYNYLTPSFTKQILVITGSTEIIIPNYVCFHNTFFLFASGPKSLNPQAWYAFEFATESTVKFNTQMLLQTKPDYALAVKRLPGRGNYVIVFGATVAEIWNQVGGEENYVRTQSFNIDNGCVSTSTIAANEQFVCWLAQNETNAPFIMISDGSSASRISTDGIDYQLSQIKFPKQSTAFFYRQDGHLFYQITFYNQVDNLTLIYDFTTQKFFNITNESLNYHPARQIVFFNEKTYFISLKDGSIYNMDTDLVTYNYSLTGNNVGEEIPRLRICNTVRLPNSSRFRIGSFTFWIEQGQENLNPTIKPRVDMSFSKDGNQSFGSDVSKQLNEVAHRRNQIKWWRMGQANEFTIQLRFWGFQRMVVTDGILNIY